MKKILTCCAVLSLFTSFSQITINSTDCATAGNSVLVNQSNDLMSDFQTTGPNITWNFSNLTSASQSTLTFGGMTGLSPLILFNFGTFAPTKYKATYWLPTNIPIDLLSGILPVEFSDINQYTRLTADSMTLVGLSVMVSGFGVPAQSDTIETRLKFPLNFGNTHFSRGYTAIDLNPIADGAWSQNRTRTTTVDGWGSVTTPAGTFDALRVKHEISESNSITYQGFTIPVPAINTVEYEWWANGKKIPVLKMTTIDILGNEQLTAVEYLDGQPAGIDANYFGEVVVYPNPTTNLLTVSSQEIPDLIELIDLLGKVVISDKTPNISNNYSLENLNNGVYQLRLTKDGNSQSTRVIKN